MSGALSAEVGEDAAGTAVDTCDIHCQKLTYFDKKKGRPRPPLTSLLLVNRYLLYVGQQLHRRC